MALKLQGRILDPYGNPVPKAEIKFQAQANNERVLQHAFSSTVADTSGNYSITVESGQYTISVKYQQGGSFRVIAKNVRVDSSVAATDINTLVTNSHHENEATPEIIVTLQAIKASVNKSEQAAASSAANASASEKSSKSSAEEAKKSQDSASQSASAAATSQQNAAASLSEATTRAGSAATSSKSAADYAKAAGQSEDASRQHREAAANSATSASHSEASSLQYQDNAKTSALAAASSQGAAKSSETGAENQAKASADSASSAKSSADSAAESLGAANLAKDTANVAKDTAQGAAAAAKTSETQAGTSAATAKEAEKNAYESTVIAKTSEKNAQVSENNAKASEMAAKDSETSVSNNRQEVLEKATQVRLDRDSVAKDKEFVAKSKESIDASERNVTTKSSAASDSAAAAKYSATTANNYASQAQAVQLDVQKLNNLALSSANKAADWATKPHGTQVEDGKFSALHWAEEARMASQGAMKYRGDWDFKDGKYPSNPTNGSFWQVTAKATVDGYAFEIGDQLSYMEDPDTGKAKFFRVSGANAVTSVAGRIGAVTLDKSDIKGLEQVRNVDAYSKSEAELEFASKKAFDELSGKLGTASEADVSNLVSKQELTTFSNSLPKAAATGKLVDGTGSLPFDRLSNVPEWIQQTHEDQKMLYMRAADGTQYRLGNGTLDFFNPDGDTVFSVDSKGVIQTGTLPAYRVTGTLAVANGGTGRSDGTGQFSSLYLNGKPHDSGVLFTENGENKLTAGEDSDDPTKTGNITVDTWNSFAVRSTFQSWQTTFKHCGRTGNTYTRGDLFLYGGNERGVANEQNALWLQGEATKLRVGYGSVDFFRPNGDKVLSVDGSSTISLMMNENAYLKNSSGAMAVQSNDGTTLFVQNEDVISSRNSSGDTTFRVAKGIMTHGEVPEGRFTGVLPVAKGGTGRTDGSLKGTTAYLDAIEFLENNKITQGDDNGDDIDKSGNINIDTWNSFAIRSTINNYRTAFKFDARSGDLRLRGSIYGKTEFSVKSDQALHLTGGTTKLRVGYNNFDFHRSNGDKVLNVGPNGELNLGKGQGIVRSLEGRIGMSCAYGDELWLDGGNVLAVRTSQGEQTLCFSAGRMTVGKVPVDRLTDINNNSIGTVIVQNGANGNVQGNNIYQGRMCKAWEIRTWFAENGGISGTWVCCSVTWIGANSSHIVVFQKVSNDE